MKPNRKILRGQIYYISSGGDTKKATGCEQRADRFGIIVSNNDINRNGEIVEVIYLTLSTAQKRPLYVPVVSSGKQAAAICKQIHTVDKSRLGAHTGDLTHEEQLAIDKALLFNLFHVNASSDNMQSMINTVVDSERLYKEKSERQSDILQKIEAIIKKNI